MASKGDNEMLPTSDESTTVAEVNSILVNLMSEINAGTFSEASTIWPFVADDFSIRGTTTTVSSKEDTLLYVRDRRRNHPFYHVNITNTKTDVNSKLSVATVWANLKCSGLPEGLTKDVVSVFDFRKDKQGVWLAVCVTNLLGPGVEGN